MSASIAVTGSVAWDHIMNFPGRFKDHILADKLHILNVSFLVQDLRRTRLGYLLASVVILLLTRSDVVKSDSLMSVEGAFTMAEAARLCDQADLGSAEVRPCWPQRYTIRWDGS